MNLNHLFENSFFSSDEEREQGAMDATRSARLNREREPAGSDKIDAMLAQRYADEQAWKQTADCWLKQRDTQQHISGPFKGRPAAEQAYRELVQRTPELKGNVVITYSGPDGVAEESALDRVRDKLSSQGYAPTQQHRLRDRERHNEKLDAIHQSFLNRQQNSDQADDARTQHDNDVRAWQLQQLQRDADDHERTMDMFRDRLNRYQYGTQRDVDPEQLAAISNIQYQPRRKKSDFVPKNEGAELDKFKTKSGKFPEPRERKPGQVLSKSETLGRDGKIYHWQDPRAKQGVAEGDPGYNKHSFVGKIRRGIEADNKGWGQLGNLFAADKEEDAMKALRRGNRYYNMTRGSNRTPGGFPKTTVEEGSGNIGQQIRALYQKIYDQGDDAVESMYYDSPIFAQYWDEYEGDLDSIIAEVDPSELQVILAELQSAAEDQGLAEAPGAETLSHNQSTVASNLNSLDLGEGDISQLEKDIAAAPVAPIANMEGDEKIGGRHDADDFDAMVMRLKKLAGSGPMRTVYDPAKRVYRNVPTAQQPPQQPKK